MNVFVIIYNKHTHKQRLLSGVFVVMDPAQGVGGGPTMAFVRPPPLQVLQNSRVFEVFTANTSIIVAPHFTSRRKWDDESSSDSLSRRDEKGPVHGNRANKHLSAPCIITLFKCCITFCPHKYYYIAILEIYQLFADFFNIITNFNE